MRFANVGSATAMVLMLAGPAWAQQTTTTTQTTVQTGPQFREIKDEKTVVQPFNLTVEKLDDMKVYGPTGERIGEIDEVLVDASGNPVAFTIEVGGFLGIGDREVIVSFDQVQLQGDRFLTSLTKQQIETLPKWDG